MIEAHEIPVNWYLLIYVVPTIVGGFLAGSSVWINNWLEQRRKEKYFIQAIKDDLEKSMFLYQSTMDDWSKSNTVWFGTVDEIVASRKLIENHWDYLLVFSTKIRRRLSEYYLRSRNVVFSLKAQQTRKHELDKQYGVLFDAEKLQQPDMTEEQIRKKILSNQMFRESREYDWLCANLPNAVLSLAQLRIEAQALLDILPN